MPLTIGKLLDLLEKDQHISGLEEVRLHFLNRDGLERAPGEVASWRGSYDLPALTIGHYDARKTVRELVKELYNSTQRVHHGWKGGEYTFTFNSPLWVSNEGEYHEWAVVGVRVDKDGVKVIVDDERY